MAPSLSSLFIAMLPLVSGLPDLSPATVKITNDDSPNKMENSWLLVWKNALADDAIKARRDDFAATLRKRNLGKRDVNGNTIPREAIHYDIGSLRMTVCNADAKTMNLMVSNAIDAVDYVEANEWIDMFRTENETEAPPAVNATAVADGAEASPGEDGEGTVVYIVDTGINVNHVAFEDRATMIANLVRGESEQDLNGHGTHCAGSAAGKEIGVATKALIRGVKVLNAKGSGGGDSIIGGFRAACNDVKKNGFEGKCVVSMSLGTGRSNAINNAAKQMGQCGCAIVVAAGNDGKDASTVSPASSDDVITVGATDARTNQLAAFSNTGPLVDISTNGVNVISADANDITGTKELTGTSMSAPQIAGIALVALNDVDLDCTIDCTDRMRDFLQKKAQQEKPIAISSGDSDTTPLQIDATDKAPTDPDGPTPISKKGQQGKQGKKQTGQKGR
ncbi:Peptidase S8, subtilisin-related protein [Ophiocordyceps sinensis CO18]|uniref:Peptidase S8, subtilisin-related protein n=1 Tax=Ophiocordyceps sinensis (strain Co18 / CGMCC 3.14243) TaxID=911162 RepID=T5ADL1_OPHSC|nr:Peptidase S8, subtilisin-related protein [Ophiocordyceps sinensis CO18]